MGEGGSVSLLRQNSDTTLNSSMTGRSPKASTEPISTAAQDSGARFRLGQKILYPANDDVLQSAMRGKFARFI